MIEYVVGFIFNVPQDKVLMIRKINPQWQRGLLNGIGGKVDPEDYNFPDPFHNAMVRECNEEAGLNIDFNYFLTIQNENFKIKFYKSIIPDCLIKDVVQKTEEELEWINVEDIYNRTDLMDNIVMLVSMCLNNTFLYGNIKVDNYG